MRVSARRRSAASHLNGDDVQIDALREETFKVRMESR